MKTIESLNKAQLRRLLIVLGKTGLLNLSKRDMIITLQTMTGSK